MSRLTRDIRRLKSYFLSKNGGVVRGDISPNVTDTHDLGRTNKRWKNIYAENVFADSVAGGGGGGDADTVDGFDAAQNPLPNNLLALDPQAVFPIEVYPAALLKSGVRALEGNMAVVAGATIDGVDISEHTHTGTGSDGAQLAHSDLSGLDADDHPQYTQRAQDEIITGDWMFTHLQDRSAGWQFLPDDKVFKAIPHNMIFTADTSKASISLGALVSSEYAIYIYDDDVPTTYVKIGRGDNSITLHGTDSTYKLWAGAAAAGSAPFRVENDGSIYAVDGEIAGWDIDTTTISKNDLTLNSVGRIVAGTGNELIQIDAADPTWRIWVGHTTAASAPFRVNKLGQMYMYDAFVTGTLKSTNFISGQQGFSLDSSGLAEFDQIIARGRLQAMVFAEAAISVASGKLIISDGAVLSVDCTDTDDYITVDADTLQQNDIIRLKPDAVRDEWMRITSPYTIVADGFKYYVARGLNDAEPTWDGPYDFYAGESVVRLGSAEQTNVGYPLSAGEAGGEYGEYQVAGSGASTGGGYLILEGSRSFGPFFGVSARYGPVYDQIIDVVRIGNLNGILDYTSEEWGAFFGDDNQYFAYDQTDGLRIEFSGTDVDSSIGKTGIKSETFRFAKVTSSPAYANYEAKVWFVNDGGTLKLKSRLKDDATEVERELGDMFRSVYDSDLDDQVEAADYADNADTVDGEHADDFADASHDHVEEDITDLDHDAAKIKGKAVDTPVAGDDQQQATYDNASGTVKWIKVGGNVGCLIVLDGSGSVISTGIKIDIIFPDGLTIKEWVMYGDQSGSAVLDLWHCTYTEFDNSTHPVVGDSITASAKPTISAAHKGKDSTLTGWAKAASIEDCWRLNVDSCSGFNRLSLLLIFDRTQ